VSPFIAIVQRVQGDAKFYMLYRVFHFEVSISAPRLRLGSKPQQILTLARVWSTWDFQPLGAKARVTPVDFSDALEVKPVHQGTSENDAASDCRPSLAERDVAREIYDDIITTLGPDAVSYSSVQLPTTFARHDFLLRNQNPIQRTFNEISMIQSRVFYPLLKIARLPRCGSSLD
jgi:hypothetical protein